MMCEESGQRVDVDLLRPLQHFVRAHYFASPVVAPWGYNG
jgi:hypothetical protein